MFLLALIMMARVRNIKVISSWLNDIPAVIVRVSYHHRCHCRDGDNEGKKSVDSATYITESISRAILVSLCYWWSRQSFWGSTTIIGCAGVVTIRWVLKFQSQLRVGDHWFNTAVAAATAAVEERKERKMNEKCKHHIFRQVWFLFDFLFFFVLCAFFFFFSHWEE